MFIAKAAFRDLKTMEHLLDLEPPNEEMLLLRRELYMLDLSTFSRKRKVESASTFNNRLRLHNLARRAGLLISLVQ